MAPISRSAEPFRGFMSRPGGSALLRTIVIFRHMLGQPIRARLHAVYNTAVWEHRRHHWPAPPHQEQLHQRIMALSWAHPRYGYRRIRVLLGREGWMVSRKHVQHIRRQEGLKVRPKPQKIPRRGVSTGLPTQAIHRHHVWSWDFIFDRTDKGGTLKMMTLLDEYTRQSLAIQVERQLTAPQVLAVLEKAMAHYGVPGYIRSDNGPEFIAAKVQQELGENQIKTIYINSGSSWQNDNIQSCQ